MFEDETDAENVDEKPADEETTMGSLGSKLPMGIEVNGALDSRVEILPWTLKQEREIGKMRDQKKSTTVYKFVGMILSTLCTRIGPHDFCDAKVKKADKFLAIGQMFLCDVLYLFLWLRNQSLGPKVEMKLECLRCEKKFAFQADLDQLPITTGATLEETLWKYKPKRAFEIRGQTVEEMTFGPTRWSIFKDLEGVGALKVRTIVGSLYEVNGKPIPIAEHELDAMPKIDFETIMAKINDKNVGADMSLEIECPHCGHEFVTSIDWTDESFFGASGTE